MTELIIHLMFEIKKKSMRSNRKRLWRGEELIFSRGSGHNNRVLLVTRRKIQRPCRGLCTWPHDRGPNNGRFYNDLLFPPGVQSLIKVAKFRGRVRNGRFRIRLTNSICKF